MLLGEIQLYRFPSEDFNRILQRFFRVLQRVSCEIRILRKVPKVNLPSPRFLVPRMQFTENMNIFFSFDERAQNLFGSARQGKCGNKIRVGQEQMNSSIYLSLCYQLLASLHFLNYRIRTLLRRRDSNRRGFHTVNDSYTFGRLS